MQKLSLRKMSLLGLVLMGASALTAAVVPAKEDKKDQGNDNGRLLPNSATAGAVDVLSCVAASAPFQCTATDSVADTTTGRGLLDSFVGTLNTDQTVGNTSNTRLLAGDQTSVVE